MFPRKCILLKLLYTTRRISFLSFVLQEHVALENLGIFTVSINLCAGSQTMGKDGVDDEVRLSTAACDASGTSAQQASEAASSGCPGARAELPLIE